MQACTVVDKLAIPTIDVDTNPSAKEVIDFVRDMRRFEASRKEEMVPIMMKAFVGKKVKEWCRLTGCDMQKTLNLLVNWMMQKDDWFELSKKLEKGEPLSDDLGNT